MAVRKGAVITAGVLVAGAVAGGVWFTSHEGGEYPDNCIAVRDGKQDVLVYRNGMGLQAEIYYAAGTLVGGSVRPGDDASSSEYRMSVGADQWVTRDEVDVRAYSFLIIPKANHDTVKDVNGNFAFSYAVQEGDGEISTKNWKVKIKDGLPASLDLHSAGNDLDSIVQHECGL